MVFVNTFILDFQSTKFDSDSKIATEVLLGFQKKCDIDYNNSHFEINSPTNSVGWSFAKLFISAQLVEKIYATSLDEIDNSKGKKFEEKFISWLIKIMRKNNCEALIKMALEMK